MPVSRVQLPARRATFSRYIRSVSVALVHFLKVILEIPLLIKALAAHVAHERIALVVRLSMPNGRGRAPEGLAAELAAVGLLIGVGELVPLHVLLAGKAPIALFTAVQVVLSVKALVHRERGALPKALAANVADVRSLVRVRALVLVSRHLGGEFALAEVALVVLDLLVDLAHVARQRGRDREALAAHLARAELLVRVHALVGEVVVGRREELRARRALEERRAC